jgi:hypothetical protein
MIAPDDRAGLECLARIRVACCSVPDRGRKCTAASFDNAALFSVNFTGKLPHCQGIGSIRPERKIGAGRDA